jgi:hypothetical protein
MPRNRHGLLIEQGISTLYYSPQPPLLSLSQHINLLMVARDTRADPCRDKRTMQAIQNTEPARFQCLTSREHGASGLRKCGSPIEMDAMQASNPIAIASGGLEVGNK